MEVEGYVNTHADGTSNTMILGGNSNPDNGIGLGNYHRYTGSDGTANSLNIIITIKNVKIRNAEAAAVGVTEESVAINCETADDVSTICHPTLIGVDPGVLSDLSCTRK